MLIDGGPVQNRRSVAALLGLIFVVKTGFIATIQEEQLITLSGTFMTGEEG